MKDRDTGRGVTLAWTDIHRNSQKGSFWIRAVAGQTHVEAFQFFKSREDLCLVTVWCCCCCLLPRSYFLSFSFCHNSHNKKQSCYLRRLSLSLCSTVSLTRSDTLTKTHKKVLDSDHCCSPIETFQSLLS